jgi:hypothetical protein
MGHRCSADTIPILYAAAKGFNAFTRAHATSIFAWCEAIRN